MKTILYTKADGVILEFIDEDVDMDGLATGLAYIKSETADGSEINISEISDGVRGKRVIDGCKISSVTEAELNAATTVAELKTFLSDIFFGN
jgi:hypothetical protein